MSEDKKGVMDVSKWTCCHGEGAQLCRFPTTAPNYTSHGLTQDVKSTPVSCCKDASTLLIAHLKMPYRPDYTKKESYTQDLEGSISLFIHSDSFTPHVIPQNVPKQII